MRLLICTPYHGILYFWHFCFCTATSFRAWEWNSSHAVRCGGDGCKNHYRLYAYRPMGIYGDLHGEPAGMDRGVYSVMAVLSDSDS